MPGFYDQVKRTVANSDVFVFPEDVTPHFPTEGVYVGKLFGPKIEFPALADLRERGSICFLYNSLQTRVQVNHCIENVVWRLAACLPPKQCRLLLYNGGQPGESFKSHLLINDFLFQEDAPKVYIDGSAEQFGRRLDVVYDSILARMSAVSIANKSNLIELNESLGKDAKIPFQFIVLTDFPHGLDTKHAEKLSNIVKAGAKAGIFVILSWDMAASFEENRYGTNIFNPQAMLREMEIIYPSDNKFMFRNSGHDEVLNRFLFELDGGELDVETVKKCASSIDKNVKEATKVAKRGILKQDFDTLKKEPYVPTNSEISVSIGVDIASKQNVTLKFNSGDYIHAFILGQSGSGKSVLLNNIISSAILKYSPEDLVLYLMDFKGVEFNRYKGEKHTKAVLVDNSDPQMTLEVLRELREENKKRVKLWQREGVNNIDGYNKKHPDSRLPQVLFVADECQVMFQAPRTGGVQMDIHREISDILNTIATQGRSQGIHMLLATQQLDETDISGQVLKNLTECLLLMSAPSDSNLLVPDSSDLTAKQATGLACYYHKKDLKGQVQTFYATDDELEAAINYAQVKAKDIKGNGESYFNGSAVYSLSEKDIKALSSPGFKYPTALLGKNIGMKGNTTTVPLRDDFSENVLIFGANKQEQSSGVLMNALLSLMLSCKMMGKQVDFLVIDCISKADSPYKSLLAKLEEKGYCHLIERQRSGRTIKAIAKDIKNGCATPVILAVIGSERFIEMKRNQPICDDSAPEVVNGIEVLGFSPDLLGENENKGFDIMTFQQVFTYILDEGPMHDVHVLLQVDKPGNILFEGDYGINATDKFRHKIILRSENKFLSPIRFSKDIDVETLSDEEEHLRAYYYPEGDDPVLFTPFILPDIDTII
jgi:energy-coupling factor transporter ATP-binding protein EcfA2